MEHILLMSLSEIELLPIFVVVYVKFSLFLSLDLFYLILCVVKGVMLKSSLFNVHVQSLG